MFPFYVLIRLKMKLIFGPELLPKINFTLLVLSNYFFNF